MGLSAFGSKLFWGGRVGRYSFMCVGFSGEGWVEGFVWLRSDGSVDLRFDAVPDRILINL